MAYFKRAEFWHRTRLSGRAAGAWLEFQSTPPAEARGDQRRPGPRMAREVSIHSPRRSEGRPSLGPRARPSRRFNPLPPPKRGETCWSQRRAVRDERFQSTPPAQARGDPLTPTSISCYREFQSTPPAEARGDLGVYCGARDGAPWVSIHSPRRSEGRRRQDH